MIGSACFALGSVPAYAEQVGAAADATTYFVGSIFFTLASYGQLVQAQTPAMAPGGADRERHPVRLAAWLPADLNWRAAATQFPGTLFFNVSTLAATAAGLSAGKTEQQVWRPDFLGSVLFLVASGWALLALGPAWRRLDDRSWAWKIGWLNMAGSIAFMVSAIGAFVEPDSGSMVNVGWATTGTFVGAVCFFAGAAMMLPAWRAATDVSASRTRGPSGR